mmetsp:Transcript_19294/g.61389  ORF Transcript_19294/g.61389 Transcript_19294/m.61389 type:complete len:206 (+) Transcript_19294:1034-1651(+)
MMRRMTTARARCPRCGSCGPRSSGRTARRSRCRCTPPLTAMPAQWRWRRTAPMWPHMRDVWIVCASTAWGSRWTTPTWSPRCMRCTTASACGTRFPWTASPCLPSASSRASACFSASAQPCASRSPCTRPSPLSACAWCPPRCPTRCPRCSACADAGTRPPAPPSAWPTSCCPASTTRRATLPRSPGSSRTRSPSPHVPRWQTAR